MRLFQHAARRARRWGVVAVVAAMTVAGAGTLAVPALADDAQAGAPAATAEARPGFPLPPLPGSMRDRGTKAKERFDRKAGRVSSKIASWGVDEATGRLTVNVVGRPDATSARFTADEDPAAVTVVPDSAPVRPYADLVGGQAIYSSRSRCSIGFTGYNRYGFFVITAGHCTAVGGTWSGYTRAPIGPVASARFPGDDFGAIFISDPKSAWRPTARVQGGPNLRGSVVARIGAQVCRSGSTTGYRCGVVQAYNQTVNYGSGNIVYGLTRTSACAEPGDSGGTYVTPAGQAQGITSGGSGDCRRGGITYFQPIGEILQRYAMTLVTG